jgi:predicted GIY-YIG superfamily endonuclease
MYEVYAIAPLSRNYLYVGIANDLGRRFKENFRYIYKL